MHNINRSVVMCVRASCACVCTGVCGCLCVDVCVWELMHKLVCIGVRGAAVS